MAQVQVKTYKNAKDYERDATRMSSQGWMPQGQSSSDGRVTLTRLAAVGVFAFAAKKGKGITVTWVQEGGLYTASPVVSSVPKRPSAGTPISRPLQAGDTIVGSTGDKFSVQGIEKGGYLLLSHKTQTRMRISTRQVSEFGFE